MTREYQFKSLQPKNLTSDFKYSVTAFAFRQADVLTIQYHIHDPLHEIQWAKEKKFERQDYLWENTCFEAFIGTPNQSNYFELNISPSLAWNFYRFTDYRTPTDMPPNRVLEPALTQLEITDQKITAVIDLNTLQLTTQEIVIGLSAIIKTSEKIEYLALHHPKSEADFHDSTGWTIRLLPDAQK